jgi:hypothetical protein
MRCPRTAALGPPGKPGPSVRRTACYSPPAFFAHNSVFSGINSNGSPLAFVVAFAICGAAAATSAAVIEAARRRVRAYGWMYGNQQRVTSGAPFIGPIRRGQKPVRQVTKT